MHQQAFLQGMLRTVVAMKENVTRKKPTSLLPFVMVQRDRVPVAQVRISRSASVGQLRIVGICANGFNADHVALINEQYEAKHQPGLLPINPLTQRIWAPGEITEAVAKHDAIARGWVQQVMSITAVNRAGDIATISLPFKYVGGRYLHWMSEHQWDVSNPRLGESITMGGKVAEELSAIMARPNAAGLLPAHFPTERDQRDLATVKLLVAQRCAVDLYSHQDDHERLHYAERLRRGGVQ